MNEYHQVISSNDKSALRDIKKAFFNELGLWTQKVNTKIHQIC